MLSVQATSLIHFVATWTMVGVIWFVQVVHYPLFARVSGSEYRDYMAGHTRMTTWIVGPPMLIEASTSALLVLRASSDVEVFVAWVGLALVAVIWMSTWLLQVPRHRALSDGFDPRTHAALVSTNWIRTIAWSLRGFLAVWWLV